MYFDNDLKENDWGRVKSDQQQLLLGGCISGHLNFLLCKFLILQMDIIFIIGKRSVVFGNACQGDPGHLSP